MTEIIGMEVRKIGTKVGKGDGMIKKEKG